MHPVLVSFGPIHIYAYGFMVALGYLVGIATTIFYAKKENIARETILDLAVYVIIAGVVGARLFYVLGSWDEYRNNLLEIIMVQKGGLVLLGGLFFSILAVVLYARVKKLPLLKLLDACAPGSALGYAIGRLGCFFNGCCFGLPTDLPWGVEFPFGSLAYSYYPHQHVHPTQLYSSLAMLLVFAGVTWLYRRKKFDGYIFYWWIILYAVYRFSVEFFRFSPLHWLGLTPSQWMVLVAGIAAVAFLRKQVKAHG